MKRMGGAVEGGGGGGLSVSGVASPPPIPSLRLSSSSSSSILSPNSFLRRSVRSSRWGSGGEDRKLSRPRWV